MKATLRAGSAIAILTVVTVLAVLLVRSVVGSVNSSDSRAGATILAAMRASGLGTQLFPRTAEKRTCTVRGGGPPPGVSFADATCETKVIFGEGGAAIVYFTHVINGGAHTWVYRVSPTLRVRFLRSFGPGMAPEYWY